MHIHRPKHAKKPVLHKLEKSLKSPRRSRLFPVSQPLFLYTREKVPQTAFPSPLKSNPKKREFRTRPLTPVWKAANRPFSTMLHVCHITPGLGCGGAENTLHRLVTSLNPGQFRNTIVSLTGAGHFGPLLSHQQSTTVHTLGLAGGAAKFGAVATIPRLASLLRRLQPDIVQTWMYLGDLFGAAAALLARYRSRLVWNVRHANLSPATNKPHTIWAARLSAAASGFAPRKIVFCSHQSQLLHEQLGYPPAKSILIENGVDVARFQPDPQARRRIREELRIPQNAPLIGLIARFDPLKDHLTFIRSAAAIASAFPVARFLVCGRGISPPNAAIAKAIADTGREDRFHLSAERSDIPAVMAALDIACSSSIGESFPNTVAEAMSCAVPCVATNVGATAHIVGDCGAVVPPSDVTAFTRALHSLLVLEPTARLALGSAARLRIATHFSQSAAAEKYSALYREVGLS